MPDVDQSNCCPPEAYPACLGRLAGIEAKLDILISAKIDQEARLRGLEAVENQAKGGLKAIIGISSGLGALMGALVSWALAQLHKN
jgi:hypothetical protein